MSAYRELVERLRATHSAAADDCADAIERLEREREALREALREVHDWRGLCDENEVETFERIASLFYRETGMLRPGKDDRLGEHDYDERWACWNSWCRAKNAELDGRIRAVLAKTAPARGEGEGK